MLGQWQLLALSIQSLCVFIRGASTMASLGKPLSIPPSQFWYGPSDFILTPLTCLRDGNDGPWSTFRIGVRGEPMQQMRVLPASDQSSTWLILPEACPTTILVPTEDCSETRGGLYMRNISKTWHEYGQYELNTYLEKRVGYDGDGLYGWDDLSLGWNGDGLPTLDNQSIAGIISPNFTVGSLALSARPINFTDYNNPIPSLLHNLRNMSTPIPSLSWSYTAGSYNLAPKVFGSLVLGGYDSTRFEPNNVSFPFGSDISLDFQVAIQRVTVNGTSGDLLSTPIVSYISTLIPDIYLPVGVCSEFAKAFGLSYDTDTLDYYVNSSMHDANLSRNPVVSFQVGPEVTGASATIRLPYWNFYLAVQNSSSTAGIARGVFRFPIKQAAKDTQYMLGRSFLQSAYLSADYERNSFNLSQALFPTSATKENLVPIPPLTLLTKPDQPGSSNRTLGTGVIAGIAAGGTIAAVIIATLLYLLYRRKEKKKQTKSLELDDNELENMVTHEMPGDEVKHEMQVGTGQKHEMAGDLDHKIELSASNEQEKPLEMEDSQREVYELPATESKRAEMEGEGHVKELG